MAKTIDNLGIDISTQYAQGRQDYDESLIKESANISQQTQVEVTLPFQLSEFDALFELSKRGTRWPSVDPPDGFFTSRRKLFSEQLIPGIRTPEAQETQMERLAAFGNDKIAESANADHAAEIGREQAILMGLLKVIQTFDQELIEINSRRVQYQKG